MSAVITGRLSAVPEGVKRPTRFPRREQAAKRTRSRIRDAAAELFVKQGYVLTTIGQIADAAGVAPRTVFNAFPGGKSQLFSEALAVALGGDESLAPLAARSSTMAALDGADPTKIAEGLARFSAELYERASPIITTYLESAGADAEMRRHADVGAIEASKIMQQIAASLHERGALRPEISTPQAGDALFALCSPQVHHLLCHLRGWTSGQYQEWLSETIESSFLRPGPEMGDRRSD